MHIPFLSTSNSLPFDDIQKHAETVKECGWAFQQAIECHISDKCHRFDEYQKEVNNLESEADAIKRYVRAHMPSEIKMPVLKFQIFMYLKEQDKVLDSVEDALNWLSHRTKPGIPEELKKDLLILVDLVIDPIEELSRMVSEARKYFDSYSEKQRNRVKEIIHHLRKREHEVDLMEEQMKHKVFSMKDDPVTIYHTVKLIELIGAIADHAENAGDMMRAMIAKQRRFFFK